MRIRELRLRDVRGIRDLRLELAPGLNWITGPNGSGKTTLVDAIGFALFDAPLARGGPAAASAVREGSGSLEVAVVFEQAGTVYRAVRSLHLVSTGPAADEGAVPAGDGEWRLEEGGPGGTLLAEGADEVPAAIAGLTGTPRSSLSRLFRGLVAVPQGDIGRVFLQDPGARAFALAPLLGLDRYPRAAAAARAAAASFREHMARLDRDAERDARDSDELRSVAARLEVCSRETAEAESREREAQSRLARLAAEAGDLEQARERAVERARQGAVLAEMQRSLGERVRRAAEALAEAEESAALQRQAEAAARRWEALESECAALEARRSEEHALRAEVGGLEARDAAERSAIEDERDELTAAIEANQQEAERLLAERDALRALLEGLRGRSRWLEGAGNALAIALDRAERLAALLAGATPPEPDSRRDREALLREAAALRAEERARAAARDAHEAELETLRARARTEDDDLARLRETREASQRLEGLLAEVRVTLDAVRPALGACPFFRAPCSNVGGKSLVQHFESELERLSEASEPARAAVLLAEARCEEARLAKRTLAARERERPAAAGPTRQPGTDPSRPARRESSRPAPFDFDEMGHHLSALAGVIAAIEPPDEDERSPVALIGAAAGVGDPRPASGIPPAVERLSLPDLAEIDEAQRLAEEGTGLLKRPASETRDARAAEVAGLLARVVRGILASTAAAHAQVRAARAASSGRSRAAESLLGASGRQLEALALERTRLRSALKQLAPRELQLLDVEIALTDRRMRLGAFERLGRELAGMRAEQAELARERETHRAHAALAGRVEALREEWKQLDRERLETEARLARFADELPAGPAAHDPDAIERIAREREALHVQTGELREARRARERERTLLERRLVELGAVRERLRALAASRSLARERMRTAEEVAALLEAAGPAVAGELQSGVSAQATRLHRKVAGRSPRIEWGADLGIRLREGGRTRSFEELSRGEQVTAALALQLALLGELDGVGLLCLDEPAAHLDPARRRALERALPPYLAGASGWLEQLLVLSHEGALELDTSHRIALPDPTP